MVFTGRSRGTKNGAIFAKAGKIKPLTNDSKKDRTANCDDFEAQVWIDDTRVGTEREREPKWSYLHL